MMSNPVMFVVEIGCVLTTFQLLRGIVAPTPGITNTPFEIQITMWLWFTVLFANFAEAMAEGCLPEPCRVLQPWLQRSLHNQYSVRNTDHDVALVHSVICKLR